MVTHKKGNVVSALENGEVNIVFQICNTQHIQSAGVALALTNKWPQVLEVDKETPKDESKLGIWSTAKVGDDAYVVNGYCQTGIGCDPKDPLSRNVRYDVWFDCLYKLNKTLTEKGLAGKYKLGMPWVGCGLAGGSFSIVKSIIEEVFGESELEVIVYKFD